MDGLEEAAVKFEHRSNEFGGLARFRTFGEQGPLYEVIAISDSTVRIHIFDNGEELDYRIDRALNDPVAT